MRTRVRAWLNHAYFEMMGSLRISAQNDEFTFDTVSGTRAYDLPADYMGMLGLHIVDRADDTAWAKQLRSWSSVTFRNKYPSGASGTNAEPAGASVIRIDGVQSRVTGTDGIRAVSDDTADTTQVATAVAYIDAGRTRIMEGSVTLNGTTAATLVTRGLNAFTPNVVFSISKSDFTDGTILFDRAGGTVIGRLQPWELSLSRYVLEFHDTPDAAFTIRIPYIRSAVGMLSDGAIPLYLPAEFAEAIEWGGKYRARDYVDDDRAAEADKKFKEMKNEMEAKYSPLNVEEPRFVFATWPAGYALETINPIQTVT